MALNPALLAPWSVLRDDHAVLELQYRPGPLARASSWLWRFVYPAATWTGGALTLLLAVRGGIHPAFSLLVPLYLAAGCVPLLQHRLRAPMRLRIAADGVEVERRGLWLGRRTTRTARARLTALRTRRLALRSGRGVVGTLGLVEARVDDVWQVLWHNRSLDERAPQGADALARACAARLRVDLESAPHHDA